MVDEQKLDDGLKAIFKRRRRVEREQKRQAKAVARRDAKARLAHLSARQIRLEETAYHEAGHAVIHWFAEPRSASGFQHVTIKPEGQTGGHHLHLRSKSVREHVENLTGRGQLLLEKEALTQFAGRLAQSKYRGFLVRWGYESDYHQVGDVSLRFCGSDSEMQQAWQKLMKIRAERMVERYWPEIQAVAARLVETETLGRDEFLEALRSARKLAAAARFE